MNGRAILVRKLGAARELWAQQKRSRRLHAVAGVAAFGRKGRRSGVASAVVTADDVRKASVAFLDQFIERGACPDVVLARDRLASDQAVGRRLEALLGDAQVTPREGYDALRTVLAEVSAELGREPVEGEPPDLDELLRWMDWGFFDDEGQTSDPAQWHDWAASVASVGANPDDA